MGRVRLRSRSRNSSPLNPGSRMSTMTQSTTTAPVSNASADAKPTTRCPRARSRRCRAFRTSSSSSTIASVIGADELMELQLILMHPRGRDRPYCTQRASGAHRRAWRRSRSGRRLYYGRFTASSTGRRFGHRDPMTGVDDGILQAHGSRRGRGRTAAHRAAGPKPRRTRPRRRQIAGRRAQRQGVRRRRAVREDLGHRPLRHRPRASAQPGHRRPRAGAAQPRRQGRVLGRSLHPQAQGSGPRQRRGLLRRRQPRPLPPADHVQRGTPASTTRPTPRTSATPRCSSRASRWWPSAGSSTCPRR